MTNNKTRVNNTEQNSKMKANLTPLSHDVEIINNRTDSNIRSCNCVNNQLYTLNKQ